MIQRISKKKRIAPEYIQEANEIYAWQLYRLELADDLIRRSRKKDKNRDPRGTVWLDLHMISKALAKANPKNKKEAAWKSYQRHFLSDRNRNQFFERLGMLTKQIASSALFNITTRPRRATEAFNNLREYAVLLPKSTAPHVVRLAVLHPGVLEHFLPKFFFQSSDLLTDKSTYRRKVRILNNVCHFGWSAKKHAEELIKSGDLTPSKNGSDVELVKKLIRDMRHRYRAYLRRGGERSRT